MRLSVVVPVYNAEGTLSRCIDSLLQQEVEGYEVLLVDDGSTDGSFALMEAYQKQRPDVIRIFQKPNGGLSDARNFGMDQARGEFLSFVDSDDFVVEGCYPALLNTAEETGCDVLFFDACRDFLSHQQPMAALPNVGESSFVTTKTYLLSMPCAWNKLIKTRLFRENRLRFPVGIWYEDLALIPQLALYAEKIYYQKQCFYHYVQSENSITRHEGFREKWWDIYAAVTYLQKGIGGVYPQEMEYLFWYHFLYETSLRYYPFGKTEKLKEIAAITRREYPGWWKNPYVKQLASRNQRLVSWLFYHRLTGCLRMGQKIKRLLRRTK